MPIVNRDDKEEQNEIQGLLCGVLHVITQKLGSRTKRYADGMMGLFLKLFSTKSNSGVHEEALMAVGAIANAMDVEFEKYMKHFSEHLSSGLRNTEDYQVCAVAVGVVGDISRALTNKLTPYCDPIVTQLLEDLQHPGLNRSVKPPILSCFGDIALAIGPDFDRYLSVVMSMLHQASKTATATKLEDQEDYDLIEYMNQLREGIFEAYTGIIQGLRGPKVELLLPYVKDVITLIGSVYQDKLRTEEVTRGAVGLVGDLAHSLGWRVKQQLSSDWILSMLDECASQGNAQTRETAKWAKEVISKP